MLSSGISLLLVLVSAFATTACNRFKSVQHDTVYVVAKQAYLRDRVAAVSNRVALVTNGQKLTVIEHNRRFVRVRTDKNEIGWLEDRAVIGPDIYKQFEDLSRKHAKDPVIATGVLRDDIYLHLKPGRDTDRYYLLPENEKLQLLVRASVAKPQQQVWAGLPKPLATPPHVTKGNAAPGKTPAPAAAPPLPPPIMEDWWLVRDSKGDVGWLLAHRLDVDVPDEISGYAEGQKIVGAYVLQTLDDPDAPTSDKRVREYVTVLNAYKDGLPYDFDQVRVFTWNMRKHRYETAYRIRNIEGYLPVTISQQNYGSAGSLPTFSFNQSVDGVVTSDPETGAAKPVRTELQTFRLEGVIVRRVAGGGQTMVQPHPASEREKENARKEKGKRSK
jgi:hypothetical protein